MTGAEYVAEFLAQRKIDNVFLLTGGACVFMVDAIGQHPTLDYKCFQHEQGAAMAADAVWRSCGKVGVTMATSGPGATNLITGIACNWFDSVPVMHITGQVNLRDSEVFKGSKVRQTGFQETQIVELIKPITKYAVQIRNGEELKKELAKAYNIAISGRMGPVLVDVPMNVQQEEVGDEIFYEPPQDEVVAGDILSALKKATTDLLEGSERPLVLFGAGVGLSGAEEKISAWLERTGVPFVSSWSGCSYFDHRLPGYCGSIGVYGNRGANNILQNCDALLVLGSRLDTRQRPGDPKLFAPAAKIHVIDVDVEELNKYTPQGYGVTELSMDKAAPVIETLEAPILSEAWQDYVGSQKEKYFDKDTSRFAKDHGTISPYEAIRQVNRLVNEDATVLVDCGATTCWFFLSFLRKKHTIFSNGGCAPISYALSAAIGAAFSQPGERIFCFIGDGGFQNNIQELQTISQYNLPITVIILNNYGYGIVKQFQDIYMDERNEGALPESGYGLPKFESIADGYSHSYHRIDDLNDLTREMLYADGAHIIDVTLHRDTPIEPKLEIGHLIHDQTPYLSDEEFTDANRFVEFDRKNLTVRTSISD
jgi:acetolactate synthase I/II/III large subunit